MIELQEKKNVLTEMLDRLAEEYPEDDVYSLDYWDGEGFPRELEVRLCSLPPVESIDEEHVDEDLEYGYYEPESFDDRNSELQEKYGFNIGYDDGKLYYGSDLRSFSGFVLDDEGDCIDAVVFTTKHGISPVGSDTKKVRRLINDAESIDYRE